MRLDNSIFLWMLPAVLVPLAGLGWLATTWTEQRYFAAVEQDALASLDGIAAALERRLLIERDLASGLARVPAVDALLPVLAAIRDGRSDVRSDAPRAAANRFFETFQSVRVSLETVRILDHLGNTLIKVRDGRAAAASFVGLGDVAHVEEEPASAAYSRMLANLRPGEVGSLLLAANLVDPVERPSMPVYNTVRPLGPADAPVGYLTIDPPLGPLNRVLAVTPRAHAGELIIAELDHLDRARDGLLLYDDASATELWPRSTGLQRLGDAYPALARALVSGNDGRVDLPQQGARIYFAEFLPYPDRLTIWLIALRIDTVALGEPFREMRLGIIAALIVALALSLLLARGAARQVARPVHTLAQGLAALAAGRRDTRLQPEGPDEIRGAGAAFNSMAASLSQAEIERDRAQLEQYRSRRLASLGQMAGGIAHEINNPINTILALTQLIERDLPPGNAALHQDVASIREECERAARTVHGILNFSRETGGHCSDFDAAEWVRETVALVARERAARAPRFELALADGPGLNGDRELLQRALRNLLDNAVQAGPVGGRVEVELRYCDGQCLVEVRDDGPGLDGESLESAFDPFFTTRPTGEGSGLGLSISLGIVQHHGGSLALANRPQGGALARLSLPVAVAGSGGV